MAQLSQFDKQATYRDDKVTVSGSIVPHVDEHGDPLQREHPIHFHFLLVREGVMAVGHTTGIGIGWRGESEPVKGLTAGPALAIGLAIQPSPGALPAFETFSWCEQIEIKAG